LKRGVFKLGEKESYSIEHRSIVALKFFRGNESIGYASGVLLSKNIILTGAHNLYNQTYGDNSGLKVYLSVDGLVEKEYQV
jgi:V8-like Glu-specific endopeptidase